MNILITGGAGFLGKYIVIEALKRGHNVTSLSRHHYPELEKLGAHTIKCDITNKELLKKIDFDQFDAIIHSAALAGVWGNKKDFFNINYIGSKNIFDHAKKSGIKYFIYTSSPSVVFGKDDIVGGDESLNYPKKFFTYYAESKAMAEKYILEDNSDILKLSIRPHLIWGPGDPHLIPRISAKAKAGKLKQVGSGNNEVDIIYVENAAIAHLDALEKLTLNHKLNKNAYFIGQERPVNLWLFINDLLKIQKIEPIESSISFSFAYKIGVIFEVLFNLCGILKPEPPMTRFIALQLAKSHWFSHKKAKNDFGFEPKISIEQGLKKTFQKSERYQEALSQSLKSSHLSR